MRIYKNIDKIHKFVFPNILYIIIIITSVRFTHLVKNYVVGGLMTVFTILLILIMNIPMTKPWEYILGIFSSLFAGGIIACLFFYLMRDSNKELTIDFIIGIICAYIFFNSFFFIMSNIEDERDKYKKISLIDGLTNCYNLNYVLEYEEELINNAKTATAFVIDIDHFKNINDTYGHMVGNNLLASIAEILKEKITEFNGILARFGGDEYLIILKDYSLEESTEIYNKIRERINNNYFEADKDLGTIRIDCSIGMGYMDVNEDFYMEKLIHIANKDMYYVKQNKAYLNSNLNLDLETSFGDLIPLIDKYNTILTVLSDKDMYTFVHSKYVAVFALQFGKHLNLPIENLINLFIAGWLHDIGKILIPDNILRKRGKPSDKEWQTIRAHVENSIDILSSYSLNPEILNAIKYHHERVDGKGYPYGLKNEDIPKEAKIMQIVDSFSAMTVKRVYRQIMEIEEALEEIDKNKGSQFDIELANEFINMVRSLNSIFLPL